MDLFGLEYIWNVSVPTFAFQYQMRCDLIRNFNALVLRHSTLMCVSLYLEIRLYIYFARACVCQLALRFLFFCLLVMKFLAGFIRNLFDKRERSFSGKSLTNWLLRWLVGWVRNLWWNYNKTVYTFMRI